MFGLKVISKKMYNTLVDEIAKISVCNSILLDLLKDKKRNPDEINVLIDGNEIESFVNKSHKKNGDRRGCVPNMENIPPPPPIIPNVPADKLETFEP